MKRFTPVRWTALAVLAGTALASTPALAVGPNQNANASAKIVKPLTLTWVQDLDLGTIVLGTGTWAATNVGITSAGVLARTVPASTASAVHRTGVKRFIGRLRASLMIGAALTLIAYGFAQPYG
jgi:hypothetical protein